MKSRFLASLGVTALVVTLAVVFLAPSTAVGQAPKAGAAASTAKAPAAKPWTTPKTPDGHPDLQGYWTNNSYTPLERPNNVTKEIYNKEELAEAWKRAAQREAEQTEPGTTADVHYDFTQFGLDRGQTRLAENFRTSLIVEPANGKLPPVTSEGQKRAAERAAERKQQGGTYDKVQNIVLGSRCVFSNPGPPMLPPGYNPAYQIIQSKDKVMILIENQHEVRVVHLDGNPHPPSTVRSWLGDSRGRWEGETLVVETTNFNEKVAFRGASENMKVTERFTRISDDSIKYEFTVNDPSTWEIPWRAEMPFVKINGPVFEHACHEGNYGIANTLAGVRLEEKKAAEAAAAKAGTK